MRQSFVTTYFLPLVMSTTLFYGCSSTKVPQPPQLQETVPIKPAYVSAVPPSTGKTTTPKSSGKYVPNYKQALEEKYFTLETKALENSTADPDRKMVYMRLCEVKKHLLRGDYALGKYQEAVDMLLTPNQNSLGVSLHGIASSSASLQKKASYGAYQLAEKELLECNRSSTTASHSQDSLLHQILNIEQYSLKQELKIKKKMLKQAELLRVQYTY